MKAKEMGDQNILNTVPVQRIAQMLTDGLDTLQKKTAYKIIKRYYKNTAANDFEMQVNFDSDLRHQVEDSKRKCLEKEKIIAIRDLMIVDLQDQISKLQLQLSQFGQEVELKKHVQSSIEGELNEKKEKNERLVNQLRALMDEKEKEKAMFKEENEELSNIII